MLTVLSLACVWLINAILRVNFTGDAFDSMEIPNREVEENSKEPKISWSELGGETEAISRSRQGLVGRAPPVTIY